MRKRNDGIGWRRDIHGDMTVMNRDEVMTSLMILNFEGFCVPGKDLKLQKILNSKKNSVEKL